MSSLSANFNISGGAGVSSLVKSAASLATQENDYQDQVEAANYANSAKTQADYNTYSNYLQGRVTALQATGSLTDAAKALSLSQTINSAFSGFSSADIARQADAVTTGNGTDQDKYDTIVSLYQQAAANGDDSLAQTLADRADTLSVTMQNAATSAASALASTNETNYENGIQSIKDSITSIEDTFKNGGPTAIAAYAKDPAVAAFMKQSGVTAGALTYNRILYALNNELQSTAEQFSKDPSITASERDTFVNDANSAQTQTVAYQQLANAEANGQQPTNYQIVTNADGTLTYKTTTNPIVGMERMPEKNAAGQVVGYTNQPVFNTKDIKASDAATTSGQIAKIEKQATADSNFGKGSVSIVAGLPVLTVGKGTDSHAVTLFPMNGGFVYQDPTSPSGLTGVQYNSKTGTFNITPDKNGMIGQPISLAVANSPNFGKLWDVATTPTPSLAKVQGTSTPVPEITKSANGNILGIMLPGQLLRSAGSIIGATAKAPVTALASKTTTAPAAISPMPGQVLAPKTPAATTNTKAPVLPPAPTVPAPQLVKNINKAIGLPSLPGAPSAPSGPMI